MEIWTVTGAISAVIAALISLVLFDFQTKMPYITNVEWYGGKEPELRFKFSTSLLAVTIDRISVSGHRIQDSDFIRDESQAKESWDPQFVTTPDELCRSFVFRCFPNGQSSQHPVLSVHWKRGWLRWTSRISL